MENLLEVHGLTTHFFTAGKVIRAVDGVDLSIGRGETVGIVGETGCGKSVAALSILRLIPWPPGKIVSGSVIFEGEDLIKKTEEEMRKVRGRKISMIFQEPRTSMNPVIRIGHQMAEVIMLHQGLSKVKAIHKAVEMLEQVHIAEAGRVINRYPHEMSGGMLQRVMIAMELSCKPMLLLADEPTTALDVTLQAQILRLIKELQQKLNTAILFITHDLGIVAQICDRAVVMYAGNSVESAPVEDLFGKPLHPYTQGLLGAVPRLDEIQEELAIIPGANPDLSRRIEGCKFRPRCRSRVDRCNDLKPEWIEIEKNHYIANCTLYGVAR
jgi:peptide/nickel transport system ATP-binding protein